MVKGFQSPRNKVRGDYYLGESREDNQVCIMSGRHVPSAALHLILHN